MTSPDDPQHPHHFPGGTPRLPRLNPPRRPVPGAEQHEQGSPTAEGGTDGDGAATVEGTFTDYFSTESLFTGSDAAAEEPTAGEGDAYAVLGVSRQASWKEISRTHRRLVSRLHPDRYVDADEHTRAAAERRVRDVNEAFAEIRRQRMPSRC